MSGFVCSLVLSATNGIDYSPENIHGAGGAGTVLDNVLFSETYKFPRLHLSEANKRLEVESKAKSTANSLPCGRPCGLDPVSDSSADTQCVLDDSVFLFSFALCISL